MISVPMFFVWLMGVLVFGFLAIVLWRNVPMLAAQRLLISLGVVLVLIWPIALAMIAFACLLGVLEYMISPRGVWSAIASIIRPVR